MQLGNQRPQVGVLAPTTNVASSIAVELGLSRVVALSPRSVAAGAARGTRLHALLITEECWPLTEEQKEELLPTLAHHLGYVFRLVRFDPKDRSKVSQKRVTAK